VSWRIRPQVVEVSAEMLSKSLGKLLLGRVVANNEAVITSVGDSELLVRVRTTDSLDLEARAEAVGYHCYRGLVTPETTFWLSQSRQGAHTSHCNEPITSTVAISS
jgi:hypothetical protein